MVASYATLERDRERRKFVLNGPCALCGGRPTDTHEIVAGSHRHKSYHERACWLRLCREPCHRLVQGADIPWQLALKLLSDPAGFDLEKFHKVWGRPLTAVTAEDVLAALRQHQMIGRNNE